MSGIANFQSRNWVPDRVERDRALLARRRMGLSFAQISEEMGYNDEFAVIDALNALYKRMRPIDVNEIRNKIANQVDDLITVYTAPAMAGDLKSANFVLKALELQAKLHGAITPPSVNVQVSSEKPWANVYAATISGDIVEGQVLPESKVIMGDFEE